MTLADMKTMLDTTKLPVAYRCFPVGDAPALPFICYYADRSDNLSADDSVYVEIENITIEFYSKQKDQASEALIENALRDNELFWNKTESYIESENCLMITYETEVI